MKHVITSWKAIVLALCLAFLVMPEGIAYAQAAVINGQAAKGQQGLDVRSIASFISVINTFMHIITLVAMQFLQYLLQSDFFTNGPMMDALNRIWQLSRDIMNILFAVMLIGVALYTIVTGDKKYVSEKLQSFIMAVILVNFSWFFPRVIIDVANVLAATVYTVPDIMGGGFQCMTWDDAGNREPCRGLIDFKLLPATEAEEQAYCQGLAPNRCNCAYHIACYKFDSLQAMRQNGQWGVGHVMLNGLIINYTKFMNLIKIPATLAGPGPGPGTAWESFMSTIRILMSIMIAFVVQGAIFLPLVALTGVLLIRILVIWMTTAFMPFAFLGYVINGKLGTGGIVKGMDFDLWEQFIGAAFLPAIIAVPITIGFIMLTAVTQVQAPAGFMGVMGIPLIFGVRTWWGLLWMIASVMVLWKGAFMAMKTNQFASGFVEKVQGFGENIGRAAIKLPLLTPLPMGGNLGSLAHMASSGIPSAIETSARTGQSVTEALAAMRNNNHQATPPIPGTTFQQSSGLITNRNAQTIVDAIQKLGTNLNAADRATNLNILRQELRQQAASETEILNQIRGVIPLNQELRNQMNTRNITIEAALRQAAQPQNP